MKNIFKTVIKRNIFSRSIKQLNFFCYQCEQTKKGKGCVKSSTCGKSPEVAKLIDLLTENLKELSCYVELAKKNGIEDELFKEIQNFSLVSNYSTLTNVNFSPERFSEYLVQCRYFFDELEKKNYFPIENVPLPAEMDLTSLIDKGEEFSIPSRIEKYGEDIVSLQELITYGLRGIFFFFVIKKGYAAYLCEAKIVGDTDVELSDYYSTAYAFLSESNSDNNTVVENLVDCALEVGENNIGVMAALDSGNNQHFGQPEPTQTLTTTKEGKCILVSGHNFETLKMVLEQTKDKDINVYTHGEMLPAHYYPKFKEYNHLIGNYGSAWQNQQKEFRDFPGSILLTTNCLLQPKRKYQHRIFSHSIVGHNDVQHIHDNDFGPVIESALQEKGFKSDEPEKHILGGFSHGYLTSIADIIVNAVNQGDIKHFWVIGGCDGVKNNRNYFTDITQQIPDDHVILTLGCGKYKFNHLDHGVIKTGDVEIPRLLDIGQCNDAYGAVIIASALANAFGVGLNELPLSMVISWFEQKAVVILLSLLYLGVKNIRLGPSIPAFLSPNILNFLIENYNIQPTIDPKTDIENILMGL